MLPSLRGIGNLFNHPKSKFSQSLLAFGSLCYSPFVKYAFVDGV
jgi:hypothetical protein